MNRAPLYVAHGPGEVTSRASGLVMGIAEAEDTARSHLTCALEHPSPSSAEAHAKLVTDLIWAIREAKAKEQERALPVEQKEAA